MDGDPTPSASARLGAAVHRAPALSRAGLLERAFTAAFGGLVYPQIWEDPEVDLAALGDLRGQRVVAIASGGCNVLSYLTADPAEVIAVDLNPHHVALVRLKLAAAARLPGYHAFARFFADAADPANPAAYRAHVRGGLDPETRAYWDARDWTLRPRIRRFARGFYRYGLLGRFIAVGQWLARRLGVDLTRLLEARTPADQAAWFDAHVAPLFDRPLIRRLTRARASLFGLGIPPAQYDALAEGRPMAEVLRARLRRLAVDFPVSDNYFAWQAFGSGYAPGDAGPLPPYLQRRHWEAVSARAGRASIVNRSMTELLAETAPGSVDAVVLLDAQDWMSDAILNGLWAEITRVAAPGARVIFRTAGGPSILPGRLDPAVLGRWRYEAARSAALHARDRSAIYGGFHLYVFEG